MAVNIEGLKDFGGHDPVNANDATLTLCMESAVEWLTNSGVTPRTDSSTYDLAVYRLATHFYDTRGNQDADRDMIPPTVIGLMHQLRSRPPDPEEGTEATQA